MKRLIPFVLTLGLAMVACDSSSSTHAPAEEEEKQATAAHVVVPVDYSLGRAMNKRLGKGINLGNAWDSHSYWNCGTLQYDPDRKSSDTVIYKANGIEYPMFLPSYDAKYDNNIPAVQYNYGCDDYLDGGWGNAIKDEYFKFLKDAGFNSVRIPVRWQHNSDPVTHKVNPDRLAGVKEDVKLAIDVGLAVIVSFHWYYEISFFATNRNKFPALYEAEKEHFAAIWTEVATAFKEFPDTMLVWDVLNEPTMSQPRDLNEVLTTGYNAIRSVDPNKTIMFESYQYAKFSALDVLELPKDGNIIYSGHYYDPYEYSHQGHSTACVGDAAYANTASEDMKNYVKTAMKLYPDINGGFIPMNVGEFGVSGGPDDRCGGDGPSEAKKALWAKKTIEAAEYWNMSWVYWGFVAVGGFEAYDKSNGRWYSGFPAAFGL